MSSDECRQIPRLKTSKIRNHRSETSLEKEEARERRRNSVELQNTFFLDMQSTYLRQPNSFNGLPADWRFNLEIVQQPIRARACGYGNKDYRSISPPIFIKLTVFSSSGPVNIDKVDSQFFQLHASLHDLDSVNCTTVWVKSSNPQHSQEKVLNLIGCRSEICHIYTDEHGIKGLWFIYANLGVRTENDYFLRFQLFYLGWEGFLNMGSSPIKELASIDSAKFKVFRNKQFPGVVECSQLTKCFAKQGANIPLRSEPEKVKNTSNEYEIVETNDTSDGEKSSSSSLKEKDRKGKYNSYN
ncbi:17978_t:CDS:2 [Cetraspora pellucida]|uniref:17978_t:CDS:1 n=1 Tax=Cetraspora pellucida TaxID=1433469 RepID=A0ACA9L5B5_9GLOM|nr:17978_t:CDS:2 [Cetraspora pellucida]